MAVLNDTLPVLNYDINEVVVKGEKKDRYYKTFTDRLEVDSKTIKSVPSFLGETDVIRAVKLQTGIQSVSEGNSGVYVRGGNSGQNLFIYDEMELMNPSHMMGLYSVFNPLTTGNVIVYKGNAPVNLNGRLASAICVYSQSPTYESQGVEMNIGNISSNIGLTWCDKNENWSLTTGFRRSYLELLGWGASLFLPDNKNYFEDYGYKFYDFNGKITGRLSSKTSVLLSWYAGNDNFNVDLKDMGYKAFTFGGNKAGVIQVTNKINSYSYLKNSIGYTSALTGFGGDIMGTFADIKSDYSQVVQKNQFTTEYKNHLIDLGLDIFHQSTIPLDAEATMLSDTLTLYSKYKNSGLTFYAGDTWTLNSGRLVVYGGVKSTMSFNYKRMMFSPVVSVSLFPEADKIYRASFAVNDQNLHLAPISSIPLPNDVWMTSTSRIKPELSEQLTFGHKRIVDGYELDFELWGKLMQNQLICDFLAEYSQVNGFEDQLYVGKGYAYGFEFSLKKSFDAFKIDLNYTYSRSMRSFNDIFEGKWFNDKYDRPHDLNILCSYSPDKKWDFSAVWVLASGVNMTLPQGRWWLMGSVLNDYEGFNEYRLPLYHRLDLSATLKLRPGRFRESELNFSVLNAYNRANPYFIFFKVFSGDSQYNLDIRAMQASLFPVMPSLSWRVKI